jgi:hypothetical protein
VRNSSNLNSRSLFVFIVTVFALSACKKINDSTEVGNGVIPAVDNIYTFETNLIAETDNFLMTDSTKVLTTDLMVLGHIQNDQAFGQLHADGYFSVVPPNSMIYPFYVKDSLLGIDSVILSLAYEGQYGDTNSTSTLRVFEIDQRAGFVDTTLFRYDHPSFTVQPQQLGAKTFQLKNLKDTLTIIRRKDTTKLVNVLRVPLANSFGTRLTNYDTTLTSNGGYRNDSLFKTLFRGFALLADNTGNGLTYINPTSTNTKLIVYYRCKKNGALDTTYTEFYHSKTTQANLVKRTPGGEWATYLANNQTRDDKVFIASSPGSGATIQIPGLDTLSNVVVHKAELILTPLPTAQQGAFAFPPSLLLDRINSRGDTALTFDLDMTISDNYGTFGYDQGRFGGTLLRDSTYRFDITRYVQKIVTNDSSNFKLRLYAPGRINLFSPMYRYWGLVPVSDKVAYGRIVIAGGEYINPAKRLRLRIVYSKP